MRNLSRRLDISVRVLTPAPELNRLGIKAAAIDFRRLPDLRQAKIGSER